eukprot:scaffold1478_cov213-Alexandrium_tamarense.AAC.3
MPMSHPIACYYNLYPHLTSPLTGHRQDTSLSHCNCFCHQRSQHQRWDDSPKISLPNIYAVTVVLLWCVKCAEGVQPAQLQERIGSPNWREWERRRALHPHRSFVFCDIRYIT